MCNTQSAFSVLQTVRAQSGAPVEELYTLLSGTFGGPVQDVIVNAASPTALNSLNGTFRSGETKYFFKFHSEEGESPETLGEMYNVRILTEAGWPLLEPCASSHTVGRQCVVYPFVEKPTMYDLCRIHDVEWLQTGSSDLVGMEELLGAVRRSVVKTRSAMLSTLLESDESLPSAPLHQLFSHRLVSPSGGIARIDSFYDRADPLFEATFYINGQELPFTISDLIQESVSLLTAEHSRGMASVIAHGDDHFANQFFIDGEIVYFDPAFAGRTPALLAPLKAFVHNTFAHPLWYYEFESIEPTLKVTVDEASGSVLLTHWYPTSPLRADLTALYTEELLVPLIRELRGRGCLPPWWRNYLRAGAFCCLFLAKNLTRHSSGTREGFVFGLGKILEMCRKIDELIASI